MYYSYDKQDSCESIWTFKMPMGQCEKNNTCKHRTNDVLKKHCPNFTLCARQGCCVSCIQISLYGRNNWLVTRNTPEGSESSPFVIIYYLFLIYYTAKQCEQSYLRILIVSTADGNYKESNCMQV